MSRILSIASVEFRIAFRNRWVTIAIAMMVIFALVLAAAGAAPTGDIGADRLSVTVASLTSLSVYLIPLLALLMSFDAIAGEVERGTLPLLLTYPIARAEVLAGKMLAHLAILALAALAGYGAAAGAAISADPASVAGLPALLRLIWTSVLLGATFLGAGYALSALARRPSGAAGLAIGLWLGAVVLYDLALLALIVSGGEGSAMSSVLPYALLANPADAFRLFNLAASEASAAAGGVGGAAASIPLWQSASSVLVWPVLALTLAIAAFRKVTP
ncbi:ABC transporter permease [Paracoccus litorisediminis]|jgi:Cu-processing system permease protein|uniref:ABC transporter permease subunit n=1 Tax=Paracoccus litorisediminis TaxID=2006130 RepID=A0A844HP98_9RHOB|nr:ABC transporter permease subunit [Paracoccus litorisediminis]MTH61720.1 ABC transporter permease subunit [Paracoccus litorisediminis]